MVINVMHPPGAPLRPNLDELSDLPKVEVVAIDHHDSFADAQAAMCGIKDITYKPIAENAEVYQQLYILYKKLHDAFGTQEFSGKLSNVMKELLKIKDKIT